MIQNVARQEVDIPPFATSAKYGALGVFGRGESGKAGLAGVSVYIPLMVCSGNRSVSRGLFR
jgi:hypothetical protein